MLQKISHDNWIQERQKCNEPVLNLDKYNEKSKFYKIDLINGGALLKYILISHNGTLILWTNKIEENKDYLQQNIKEFINNQFSKQNNLKITVYLLGYKKKYINFLKEIGFKKEAYLREHVYLDNHFEDVLLLSINNIN